MSNQNETNKQLLTEIRDLLKKLVEYSEIQEQRSQRMEESMNRLGKGV